MISSALQSAREGTMYSVPENFSLSFRFDELHCLRVLFLILWKYFHYLMAPIAFMYVFVEAKIFDNSITNCFPYCFAFWPTDQVHKTYLRFFGEFEDFVSADHSATIVMMP